MDAKKRKLLTVIILQAVIALVLGILKVEYPLTPYLEKGLAELWISYYVYPVLFITCVSLFLNSLEYLNVLRPVSVGRTLKIVLTIVLILIGAWYLLLINAFHGPFMALAKMPIPFYDVFVMLSVTKGLYALPGTLVLLLYGFINHLIIFWRK